MNRLTNMSVTFLNRISFALSKNVLIWILLHLLALVSLNRSARADDRSVHKEEAGVSNSTTSPGTKSNRMGDRYLLLVNTAVAAYMTPEKLAQFDKSPYDGIAIAFWHAYETSPVMSSVQMETKIAEWHKATKKDIWPWVYVNRMIGVDLAANNPHTDDPYFHRLKGADLEDKAGARADYLQNWQNVLHVAKDTRAPGVVCDLEFYNYYKEYDIGELSQQTGKKPEEVVDLLKSLGARMADIAGEQYPDATLWFLFTGFTHPDYKTIDGKPYYPSPTYIAMGLLDQIKKQHLRLKVLSGGEGSLAYCHDSVVQFKGLIQDRGLKFAPQLQKYDGVLELAGTMTLYSDRGQMTDWVKKDCSSSAAGSVEELEPFLELLLSSYRYNWIYGSNDGGYNAYAPQVAARFDAVIRKAQSKRTTVPAN